VKDEGVLMGIQGGDVKKVAAEINRESLRV
jgi:hypothetical protein